MIKKTLKIKFIFITLMIALLITFSNLCIFYLSAPGILSENKILIIKPKLSIKQITIELNNNKIIKYPILFELIAKIYSLRNNIKSGEYIFTTNISPIQVLKILSSGKSIIHKMIIPEGVMVSEIVEKVNNEKRLTGEIKNAIPEGFLMPSTYYFSYGDQKEQMIDKMRKLMSSNLDKIMTKLSPHSPLKTRLEVLTLASIIEKEALLDKERPIIAAVFLNRLKKNMKLQADPTTIYAVTQGKFKLNRPLTKKDLAIQSPYNTYYVYNLPPGPIACPGKKSLEAVVTPSITNALYFVVDSKGGKHNFSDNINEHNKHVENYRNSINTQ